jgi:hypothetical protein
MAATAVVFVGGLFGPGAHVPKVRVTAHDRAATRTFLRAEYAYLQSGFATEAAAKPVGEQLGATLRAECPSVLANAPRPAGLGELFEEEQHLSARQRGEQNRANTQRTEIELEIYDSLERAENAANRAGILAFAHTLESLHWSSVALTRYEHRKARALIRGLAAPPSAVCNDLKGWVASGYTKLAPGTKALARQLAPSREAIADVLGGGPDPDLILRAYETPGEHALLHRLRLLTRKSIGAYERSARGFEALAKALGMSSPREESEEPPKGATVIGSGQTANGGNYTIWVQKERPDQLGGSCAINLGIRVREANSSGTSEACVQHGAPASLRAFCNGTGWQVEGQTLEGATSVSVELHDGRQISSPVVLVPPMLGGPAGFYLQVFRKSEDPVSASELNAQGTVIGTVKLPHGAACPGHVFKNTQKPPEPLGSRKLVAGHLRNGMRFEISAFETRFMGRIESKIRATVFNPEPFISGVFSSQLVSGSEPGSRGPLKLETETGCPPRGYALLFGLLKAPEDTILAKTRGHSEPFRIVHPPASAHLHGVLAYLALPGLPDEVIVRSPEGKIVLRKSYRRQAREVRETCEGEAEP